MSNLPSFLDDIDIQILEYLQRDGKLTAKNLADQINLTQTPVYERVKKLERNGVIRKYVALLDSDVLNKSLVVFMNITIREHGAEMRGSLVDFLQSLPEVVELYHTSGRYDFMAKVRVGDVKEYRDFLVNKMASSDNIKDIVSHIVLEDIKYTTELPLK